LLSVSEILTTVVKETEDGTSCISYSSAEGKSGLGGFAPIAVPLPMDVRFELGGVENKSFPVEVYIKTIHIPL
jgi:hypothetical protein